MARWDCGLHIYQGPLYAAQNCSSHSLTFQDEYNFSSQHHSSAQNCSVSFCIIVLSLEIEYLHNLLPHLASCCILPSCTQTEIWNMFYTVSKVVLPFLYLGYSLCPKSQYPSSSVSVHADSVIIAYWWHTESIVIIYIISSEDLFSHILYKLDVKWDFPLLSSFCCFPPFLRDSPRNSSVFVLYQLSFPM